MPNRATDPETIEPAHSRLEDMLVDRLNTTRQSAEQTAIATVRETRPTDGKPAEVVKTTSVQLHSPVRAAAILARMAGMDPNSEDDG